MARMEVKARRGPPRVPATLTRVSYTSGFHGQAPGYSHFGSGTDSSDLSSAYSDTPSPLSHPPPETRRVLYESEEHPRQPELSANVSAPPPTVNRRN
jgi:hypothetical protein